MYKVLGRRGYVLKKEHLKPEQILKIKDDLTFINGEEFSTFNKTPDKFPIYAENSAKLYLPRAYGLAKFGEPDSLNFSEKELIEGEELKPFTFNGGLRDYQKEAVKKTMERFKTTLGGGIISMPCGFGKTRTTIYIIYKLKNMFVKLGKSFKCIIVVHKEFLANQWIENIQQLIPEAKIGIIQADKVIVEDKDIVLAMLQSVSIKDYPDELFNQFDFAVFDECHHLGAQVFSKALLRVGSRYLLGLSATVSRKSGNTEVFTYCLGDIIYKIDRDTSDKALVHKIVIQSDNEKYYTELYNKYNGNKDSVNMLTKLCEFFDRNKLIVDVMRKLLENEEGRKIICLSARRDDKHLGLIKEIIDKNPIIKKNGEIATVGYYMGYRQEKGYNKKKHIATLKESESCDIILGTINVASEGLDVKALNCIIFATPITGFTQKIVNGKKIEDQTTIEQSIGRILRDPPEQRKLVPIVIDILDNFSNFVKWGYTRNAFYKKVKYPMTRHVINLNKDREEKQVYNLDFLLDNSIFYANESKIEEVVEGILRDDSSLSEEVAATLCLIDE